MGNPLKIIIPMAGWGTRMRPHTWSKPKPLISVAGKTALDYLMEIFNSLPDRFQADYTFIVSPYLGETKIPTYIKERYPDIHAHYVVQSEMKGQSHALWLAREFMSGSLLIIYSDTLIETDLSNLKNEMDDGVAWVKAVPDPRRFGVAEIDRTMHVKKLIEKPQDRKNNLALVGCYYIKQGKMLLSAIEEQMQRGIMLKGEYFLVDAVNIMLEHGAQLRVQKVDTWLDTGTIESTLETNHYLLEHGNGRTRGAKLGEVKITEPIFIHETAEVLNSEIGPDVSIGANCSINNSMIKNSILDEGVIVENARLNASFIGKNVKILGKGHGGTVMQLNIGDDSSVVY